MLGATTRGGAGPALGPHTHWPALCECGPGRLAAGLCRGRWGCQDTGYCRGAGEGQGRGPGQVAVCNSVSGIVLQEWVLHGHEDCVWGVEFYPSADCLLFSAGNGSVILWK